MSAAAGLCPAQISPKAAAYSMARTTGPWDFPLLSEPGASVAAAQLVLTMQAFVWLPGQH